MRAIRDSSDTLHSYPDRVLAIVLDFYLELFTADTVTSEILEAREQIWSTTHSQQPLFKGLLMPVVDEPDLVDQEYADDTWLFLLYTFSVVETIRCTIEVFCVDCGACFKWGHFDRALCSPLINWKSPNCSRSLFIQRQGTFSVLEDISGFYGEEYGVDALSLMQQLSQQTAAAYREAENILSIDDRDVGLSGVGLVATGKENVVAVDAGCSPGALLVNMSPWSFTPGNGESSQLIYASSSEIPSPSLHLLRECR
ncbi:hypothetical protein L7F22_060940 [Adiantum nelumboides]|nr:hypothetical protein [Adiantum nelumboides]